MILFKHEITALRRGIANVSCSLIVVVRFVNLNWTRIQSLPYEYTCFFVSKYVLVVLKDDR